MNNDILYLGSQSKPRQLLLQEAGIPFHVVEQTSDENIDGNGLDFSAYVLAIAKNKMDHVVLPRRTDVAHDYIFVLTADSLVRTVETHQIFGKPKDHEDAKRILRIIRDQDVEVSTGCCLEKKVWNGTEWQVEDFNYWITDALIRFSVGEQDLDLYLTQVPEALYSAGAGIIEGFGQNFFKSINGSYTATKGLPIFELRQALALLNFKFPWSN